MYSDNIKVEKQLKMEEQEDYFFETLSMYLFGAMVMLKNTDDENNEVKIAERFLRVMKIKEARQG